MWRVLGNILCDLDAKVRGQTMYFLLNLSPPKLLDIATLNWAEQNIGPDRIQSHLTL